MSLLNFEQNSDSIPPLSKCHIGTVLDNKDPKNLCRIKVSVPGILSEKTNIWAMRVALSFPGVTYVVPDKGQKVRVWFLLNDPKRPVYGLDYTHSDEKLNNFKPGEYGFADNYGNMVKGTQEGNLGIHYEETISTDSKNVRMKAEDLIRIVGNSIIIDGDTTINGNLVVNGSIKATGDIVAGTVSLQNHTHNYSWTDPGGSGTTNKPNS